MHTRAWSNAVTITNLTMDQAAGTVTFDLAWRNSWRTDVDPNNWDAVWVFVKFRPCSAPLTDQWTHGLLSTTLGDHNFGTLEPTNRHGTAVAIDAAPNNTGAMLRQPAVGLHPVAGPYSITLRVTNLPAAGTDIDLKAIGVEMVYIPTGTFTAGDSGLNWDSRRFNSTVIDGTETTISYTSTGSGTFITYTLGSFPRGQQGFYCMKYEISQQQYAVFLNTLPTGFATTLYPGSPASLGYRFAITNSGTPPNIYQVVEADRACNFLTWGMVSSFLDWAALRPMSELEYEKVCRGLGPVVNNEYAWGTTNIFNGTALSTTIPLENGTEVFTNVPIPNVVYNNTSYGGGRSASVGPSGDRGPVRCGIFALPTTNTRQAAGAGYYGVMELSGNVCEYCVSLSTLTQSGGTRPFLPTLGDGMLAVSGWHNVADWPDAPIPAGASTYNQWVGWRGGCFYDATTELRVAHRTRSSVFDASWNFGAQHSSSITNHFYTGGRGVR
ncbi:MAG: hypothetical protein KF690_10695 [Bacteroidetes bacterium]|nr:hypothetical protein [Bacteroidota bacterium]